MGFGAIVAGVAMVVGAVVGLFMPRPSKVKVATPTNTASSTAVSISTCEEGITIPFLLGRGRITPNLLYYGGVATVPQYTTITVTGKKGKKKTMQQKEGDIYYIDLRYGICRGGVNVEKIYVDDKSEGSEVWEAWETATFSNNGVIQQVGFTRYKLGFEVKRPPTFHFVAESAYPSIGGRSTQNAAGMNPVGVIYATFIEAGGTSETINMDSLAAGFDYFQSRTRGLNFVWDSQTSLRQRLEMILQHAGGYITETVTGTGMQFKYLLRQTTDPVVAELHADDFHGFHMERVTQNKVPNFCSADFIDSEQDFTIRSLREYNLSAIQSSGKNDRTIDLTGYAHRAKADSRLKEIMREMGFPNAVLSFEVGLEYCWLNVGDLVIVNHAEYGINNLKVRITGKEMPPPDKGYYPIQAEIDPAFLQDATISAPEVPPIWEPLDYTPKDLTHVRLWEVPRTPFNENVPALMVLAARESNVETSCAVLASSSASGYRPVAELYTFCQAGTLTTAYTANTYEIDDEVGIFYKPWREDPVFDTISRADLFLFERFALVNDELMAFETVDLQPDGSIRLGGIVRGLFNTTKITHAKNAQIWLIPAQENIAVMDLPTSGNIKLSPRTLQGTLADADATPRAYFMINLAAYPYNIARLAAVRAGTEVAITWWPANVNPWGAGAMPESYTDQWPFNFAGDFLYQAGSGAAWVEIAGTSLTLNRAGAFSFTVKARQDGFFSKDKTLTIGAEDGVYTS